MYKSQITSNGAFSCKNGAKAGKNSGFRVMLKYFEIKKAFRYYIKQIDSMLPCVWFSSRSQKTSKCGENISDTLGYASCATFLFLSHFDVICDLLLNRCTATWNLFVKQTTLSHIRFVFSDTIKGFKIKTSAKKPRRFDLSEVIFKWVKFFKLAFKTS